MRENRPYGSEGGEPQLNAAFLPLSLFTTENHEIERQEVELSFANPQSVQPTHSHPVRERSETSISDSNIAPLLQGSDLQIV